MEKKTVRWHPPDEQPLTLPPNDRGEVLCYYVREWDDGGDDGDNGEHVPSSSDAQQADAKRDSKRSDHRRRGTVILLHGFPELPLSWFGVVESLSRNAGVDVVIPFLRGYGPHGKTFDQSKENFTVDKVCADIKVILEHHFQSRGGSTASREKTVVIGHDWGALITWSLSQWQVTKGMFDAIGAVALPDDALRSLGAWPDLAEEVRQRRYSMMPTERLKIDKRQFWYMLWFQKQDKAEFYFKWARRILGRDRLLCASMQPGKGSAFTALKNWMFARNPFLDRKETSFWARCFDASGYTAPINYYRSLDASFEIMRDELGKEELRPTFIATAANDPYIPPSLAHGMEARCKNLTRHHCASAGHCVPLECPAELGEAIVKWLKTSVLA